MRRETATTIATAASLRRSPASTTVSVAGPSMLSLVKYKVRPTGESPGADSEKLEFIREPRFLGLDQLPSVR
jgi:hypothetical protein